MVIARRDAICFLYSITKPSPRMWTATLKLYSRNDNNLLYVTLMKEQKIVYCASSATWSRNCDNQSGRRQNSRITNTRFKKPHYVIERWGFLVSCCPSEIGVPGQHLMQNWCQAQDPTHLSWWLDGLVISFSRMWYINGGSDAHIHVHEKLFDNDRGRVRLSIISTPFHQNFHSDLEYCPTAEKLPRKVP